MSEQRDDQVFFRKLVWPRSFDDIEWMWLKFFQFYVFLNIQPIYLCSSFTRKFQLSLRRYKVTYFLRWHLLIHLILHLILILIKFQSIKLNVKILTFHYLNLQSQIIQFIIDEDVYDLLMSFLLAFQAN